MKFLTADIVIKNGQVLTVNEFDEIKEAVAIRGNTILAVGSNADVLEYADEHTHVIDANGHTVLPGFIDAHLHLSMFGLLDHGVIDLAFPKAKSIAEIKTLVREAAAGKKAGEWIKLNGYDQNKLSDGRHLTKEDLDEVAPDHPVQCTRCCGHMGVYNTLGLKTVGVESADQYAPGEVEVNADGTLHGLLRDTAHMVASQKVVFSREELVSAYRNADRILLSHGVTSAHDAGTFNHQTTSVLQDVCNEGIMQNRVYTMIFDVFGKESATRYADSFIAAGVHSGCGNENFRVGPIKLMLDGSSSGPSSAVIEGYSHDPDNHGILVWDQDETDEVILRAHRAGFQVSAHAVGDKAVTIIVNAIEKALADTPRENHRHRIEHCGLTNPDLIERIAKLNIIPISNPSFITINGTDYNRYYGERVNYMFPLKSYLDHGIITAIGSDTPVTFPNPMAGLYAALNRKDGKTGDSVGVCQKISVLEAVRMLTYNGAYASFEENIKGSLEPGKLADIVVLDQDLLKCPAEEVRSVKVTHTLRGGKIVYQNCD
jgi:predicted amidohydrolase YtcJ